MNCTRILLFVGMIFSILSMQASEDSNEVVEALAIKIDFDNGVTPTSFLVTDVNEPIALRTDQGLHMKLLPLEIAILTARPDILQQLIDAHADIKSERCGFSYSNYYHIFGYTDMAGRLEDERYRDDADIGFMQSVSRYIFGEQYRKSVKSLFHLAVSMGPDMTMPNSSRSPEYTTIKENIMKNVCLLINNGADINQQDENGNTPLHVATAFNRFSHVQKLLQSDVDIHLENRFYQNAFDIAINKGLTIVSSDLDAQGKIKECPLGGVSRELLKKLGDMGI